MKNAEMQKPIKIFETNCHKSYEILQRIYIKHHMTSHGYPSLIIKEKLVYIEISARKLHLSAVILGLKVTLNTCFGFHIFF